MKAVTLPDVDDKRPTHIELDLLSDSETSRIARQLFLTLRKRQAVLPDGGPINTYVDMLRWMALWYQDGCLPNLHPLAEVDDARPKRIDATFLQPDNTPSGQVAIALRRLFLGCSEQHAEWTTERTVCSYVDAVRWLFRFAASHGTNGSAKPKTKKRKNTTNTTNTNKVAVASVKE